MNKAGLKRWRPAADSENPVTCSGCGARLAAAEASCAGDPDGPQSFACSPECERDVDERVRASRRYTVRPGGQTAWATGPTWEEAQREARVCRERLGSSSLPWIVDETTGEAV